MSKKHFEQLAREMASTYPGADMPGMCAQWRRDCEAIADVAQMCNPRFDRARFLQACGAAR